MNLIKISSARPKWLTATLLAAGLTFATSSQAAPVFSVGDVSLWNVGDGQANGDFQVATDTAFAGGGLELGLRATKRKVGNTKPNGNVYSYGVENSAGAGASDPNRARWNFDLHIAYDSVFADLDSLTLTITSSNATNPPSAAVVDLFNPFVRMAITATAAQAPAQAARRPLVP